MEYRHLKEKSHYEDLYDRFTVEEGRRLEKIWNEPEVIGTKKNMYVTCNVDTRHSGLVNFYMYFWKGDRNRNKSKTIEKWMQEDRDLDAHYDRVNIKRRCKNCSKDMKLTDKFLHVTYEKGKRNYVECFFWCKGCDYGMRITEFGDEKVFTPRRCPECSTKVKCTVTENKKNTTYQDSCPKCTWVSSKPLVIKNYRLKEKIDRNFEQDRARFCLNHEEGMEYLASLRRIDELKNVVEGIKSDPKNQEGTPEYIVEHLERPTVAKLQKKLAKALQKVGFTTLKFDDADEIRGDVVVKFRVQDSNESRSASFSKREFKKTVEEALLYTNWRILPTSLSYKMGVLKGKLSGTDSTPELLELVKKRGLENKPVPESLKRPSMVNGRGEKIFF
ncbi:hypothetical protein COW46_01395 [Candidatus Gracilibacteria bacterium CG17_big_fil_post_rev_8_21_14_2_50_48_13]|nr:MAG: hypothetical protein COW46_01395 [Candidatus Gracilibacteria bacterium CG17_big_fil_post_rev_8_21_14_2_50_48_13]